MLPSILTPYELSQVLPGARPHYLRYGRMSFRFLRGTVLAWAEEHGLELAPLHRPDPRVPIGLDADQLPDVVGDREAQGVLRISDSELRARRRRGECPPWTKAGRIVAWQTSDLLAWARALESQGPQVVGVDPVECCSP